MPGRRQSAADLPRAPLELVHPLEVQGGAVAGAEILSDGLGPTAVLLFRLHRALLAWTLDAESPPAADRAELRRIEDAVLSRLRKDEIAAPLAVLTAALLDPETADQKRLSWACLCISDWAIGRGARSTAVAYAQLAALSWPRHARYAWVVGRLLRGSGRVRESEPWFKRAHRVAVWTDDWEGQVWSINGLGLTHYERGKLGTAKRFYGRAISVARRHTLRELEAMVTHNLFVVHAECGEAEAADNCAARTYELYGPTHPRLAEFVADVAIYWNRLGYYWRTLPIFIALHPRFTAPEARIRIAAALARAAAGSGDRERFAESWTEVWNLVEEDVQESVKASALYEAGLGATILNDCTGASAAFTKGLQISRRCGATEISAQIELALAKLEDEDEFGLSLRSGRKKASSEPADLLARGFVESLQSELTRC